MAARKLEIDIGIEESVEICKKSLKMEGQNTKEDIGPILANERRKQEREVETEVRAELEVKIGRMIDEDRIQKIKAMDVRCETVIERAEEEADTTRKRMGKPDYRIERGSGEKVEERNGSSRDGKIKVGRVNGPRRGRIRRLEPIKEIRSGHVVLPVVLSKKGRFPLILKKLFLKDSLS